MLIYSKKKKENTLSFYEDDAHHLINVLHKKIGDNVNCSFDQKKYIAMIYKYTFYFLYNIAQIIVLLLTKNFILYFCYINITVLLHISLFFHFLRQYTQLLFS